MTIAVRVHWAHRAATALEEAGVTEYSVEISKHGVWLHLSYKDFMRFYQKQPFHRQPDVLAKPVGQGMLTYLSLSFKHGEVSYCTSVHGFDYRKLRAPAEGMRIGRWNPEHDPTPWLAGEEQ
jgi:hypothetical protein